MEDYTNVQSAPIKELKKFPKGKEAIEMSEEAQEAFKQIYGNRPKEVHIIVSRRLGPWHISARREKLINWYPDDRMVFAHYNNPIEFVGWLYFKEIRENWYETVFGYDLMTPLRGMDTFDAKSK